MDPRQPRLRRLRLQSVRVRDVPIVLTSCHDLVRVGSMDAVSVGGGARVVARMLSGSVCLIQPDGKVSISSARSL